MMFLHAMRSPVWKILCKSFFAPTFLRLKKPINLRRMKEGTCPRSHACKSLSTSQLLFNFEDFSEDILTTFSRRQKNYVHMQHIISINIMFNKNIKRNRN